MSRNWKCGLVTFILASSASADVQSGLPNIIAIQEARIKQLEEIVHAGCGIHGEPLFNSVENPIGAKALGDRNTRAFWNIPYAQRFSRKGLLTADLSRNYYNGALYQGGAAIYTDLVVDLNGKKAVIFQAQADGIDESTMKFINPKRLSGNEGSYTHQFASGWSSPDKDMDTIGGNCATNYGDVTQHYGNCWVYNLGADADAPVADDDWGPHFENVSFQSLTAGGLFTDGTPYTRVSRITRCVKRR